MVIDSTLLEEYPFEGSFYTYGIDDSKPLDEQVEEEILVLNTICDIQEATKSNAAGFVSASFNIYFPFDKGVPMPVRRGHTFKGMMYGMEVNGEVIGVFPTQMGGCSCYIKDVDT